MTVTLETAKTLRQAGHELPLPFRIELDNGQSLTLHRLLRTLPGKRLTGLGDLDGQPVLAKLFIAARGSKRHWQREHVGIEALTAHQIPTPRLLGTGCLASGGHYLLTEFLAGAQELSPTNMCLDAAFATVGRMNARGLAQTDAHLGNFLQWQDGLYVIDGDAIRAGISDDEALENLALLVAQLPQDHETTTLIAAYRRAHPALAIDLSRLEGEIARARRRRLDTYLRKCLRDCSQFKVEKRDGRFRAMLRSEAEFLAPLMADPDRWLENGTPLKRGRTATLSLVEHAGRKLVIKRYNIKGPGHALSRCWRPSRAWHSWVEGHRLGFLDVATPPPLAMLEERTGPLRGKAWLITEYCDGESLATRCHAPDTVPAATDLDAIGALLRRLVAARISHGDLKATNLLWCGGKPHLIDLDAMRQHASDAAFRRAWQKDSARFLRNWPEGSALRRALESVLPRR